jgi:hypothetical protein
MFSEEQIAFALRQAETGTRVTGVCRKMGISEQTDFRQIASNATTEANLGIRTFSLCATYAPIKRKIDAPQHEKG